MDARNRTAQLSARLATWFCSVVLLQLVFSAVARSQTMVPSLQATYPPVVQETPVAIRFVQPPELTEPSVLDEEPLEPFDDSSLDALGELQQLLNEPILMPGQPPATLTIIEEDLSVGVEGEVARIPRATPAAVTRIGHDAMWMSGARNLEEVFDIFVPNVQFVHQVATGPKMGIRGIISDRDDKFLLKVNGRILNNRSSAGAYHERDLPLLGDLHHVDFLRGPGGATDGPGAIVGVVNMQTHTGLTFQGFDATVRQGFVEDYTAAEVRYGRKFDDDTGIFLYYGVADYAGADPNDAPLVYGRTFTALDGIPIVAGEPANIPMPDDNQSFRSLAKHKMHAQFTHNGLDVWFRYTRGGRQINPDRRFIDGTALPGASFADLSTPQAGYQQFTFATSYLLELSEQLDVEFIASYYSFDFERFLEDGSINLHREDEFYSRALARWTPNDQHALAAGVAWYHNWFGLPTTTFPDVPPVVEPGNVEPWETDTFSMMAEYQWSINDRWTAFAGIRTDDHTYSNVLVSPRAVLVWMPNEVDTWKGIWTVANRRATDGDLRRDFRETGEFSKNEENESTEIRYERRPCEHWLYATSIFYQSYNAISFNPSPDVRRQTALGRFQMGGLEFEASYHDQWASLTLSHAFTKLINGKLANADITQGITAEPYGFGDDLVSWSPNLTKVYVKRKLDDVWSASSSLRVYWGFPGDGDLTAYNNSLDTPNGFLGLSDPGYKKAFRGSYFLDFGLERKIYCDRGAVRLDLYNVLGWIDQDLNKRNALRRAYYRSEAPALGLSARLEF